MLARGAGLPEAVRLLREVEQNSPAARELATWESRLAQAHLVDPVGHESLQVADLLKDRVLLVHTMDGEPLPDVHGAPLRLIAPDKLGYKTRK